MIYPYKPLNLRWRYGRLLIAFFHGNCYVLMWDNIRYISLYSPVNIKHSSSFSAFNKYFIYKHFTFSEFHLMKKIQSLYCFIHAYYSLEPILLYAYLSLMTLVWDVNMLIIICIKFHTVGIFNYFIVCINKW